jgi:hypothetical protein
MRPLPNAINQSWTTFGRLSWPVKALTVVVTALVAGFLAGGGVVGPILSDNSPDNAAVVQARFERRTVDPQRHYPEPHPYRAQSPDFGPHQGPAMGAHAKKQAQRELRGHGIPPGGLSGEAPAGLSAEARQSFGAAPPHRTQDRHTGTSY